MFRSILSFILLIINTLPAFTQEVKTEAESGQMSGSVSIFKSLSGYSGTGYVGRFENAGDKLTLTVAVDVATSYDIYIGYCAEFGSKTINAEVNGTKSAVEIPQLDGKFHEVKFGTLNLKPGNTTVIITPNWTWFHIDYVRIRKAEGSAGSFNISGLPVNKTATQETRNLYAFLKDNFQKKNISGVMTLKSLGTTSGTFMNETVYLKSITGKEPALLGLDFMDHTGNNSWLNNPDVIKDAKTWWGRNGIVALMWHWRDPSYSTSSFYTWSESKTDGTKFDLNCINDTESAGYKAMIRDMDKVAGYLKELQNAGVAVLWRPLHEAAGTWFWWGAKGAVPCIKLWRLMFDRFTNYHQLNNLIWVWTTTDNSSALTWYPGDDYVDILGMDIYPGEGQHGSQVISFNKVKEIFGGKKIVTLSECGSVPYPELMQSEGSYWSYFMPWYGDFTKLTGHNSAADWTKILESDFVITLDEMPKRSSYASSSGISVKSDPLCNVRVSAGPSGINLHFPESIHSYNIRLLSLTGNLLYQQSGVTGNYFCIPVKDQNPGLFLVQLSDGKNQQTFKVVR
jgi:mannan endo-1,4-beta-mannosidase